MAKAAADFLWLQLRELPYFRAMLRAVEAQFYQDYSLPAPTLDLGCGDGHFAAATFERRLDVGLDPWTGPLHEAKKREGHVSLVQADAGRMPFPDDTFASALSNSVLEHIPHVDKVLEETARVLKAGAPFLFCVPNLGYLAELSMPAFLKKFRLDGLAQAYTEWFRWMSRTQHADPPETWIERLQRAGFILEKWWHYFSPQALQMLEWGHYFGAPTLLPHFLFKRWILAPYRWNFIFTERMVRPHIEAVPHPQGTYTFFVARRRE